MSECTEQVIHALRRHQRSLFQTIIAERGKASELNSGVERLNGAKALIVAMASFGMSRNVESNDYLRALLFGEGAVPDGDAVVQVYADALKASERTMDVDHKRLDRQIMTERSAALGIEIQRILSEIENGRMIESYRLADVTVEHIEAYKNAAK